MLILYSVLPWLQYVYTKDSRDMKVKVTTHVIVILFSIGLPPISVKAQGQ